MRNNRRAFTLIELLVVMHSGPRPWHIRIASGTSARKVDEPRVRRENPPDARVNQARRAGVPSGHARVTLR